MKPFLGIDVTADKKSEQMNGKEFLVQKTSAALSNALEASSKKAEETVEKSKTPLPFRIIEFICGIVALTFTGSILKADVTLTQGYENAPWVYWAAGICAAAWLSLWIWSKEKAKTVFETGESTQAFSHLDGVANAIYSELAVPDHAKDVDVLFFYYKIKNGEYKLVNKGVATQYFNPVFKIFADSENLYLANLEGKYAFPRSSIGKIHTVKKDIRIAGWNKEEKLNKGIYRKYKLTTDGYGCVHCKAYHIVEIHDQGENYGIYFPSYELPVFDECIQ